MKNQHLEMLRIQLNVDPNTIAGCLLQALDAAFGRVESLERQVDDLRDCQIAVNNSVAGYIKTPVNAPYTTNGVKQEIVQPDHTIVPLHK
jgi:hypothetical protein